MVKDNTEERWRNLKRFYQLYRSDLSLAEIERLIKRDVPGLYEFYSRDMEKPDTGRNRLIRAVTFLRNFFLAFHLKLSAARRLFYSLALILFLYGLATGLTQGMVLSFLVLNVILALEVADKLVAKDELEVGREIQEGLMPETAPAEIPYDIACFCDPAREVGGDYYDFIQTPTAPDNTFIVIGDVKGKGMAAALYMVRIQALLQYVIDQYHSPAQILVALNQNIRRILKQDYFFSMAVTRVRRDGQLQFARAGHMPLIHYQAKSDHISILKPPGMAVGLENGTRFNKVIEEISLQPQAGDVLVYYTDGVVETMDSFRNQYGDSALERVIRENAAGSASDIKNAILKDLAKFRGTASPHDDLTLIIAKRQP